MPNSFRHLRIYVNGLYSVSRNETISDACPRKVLRIEKIGRGVEVLLALAFGYYSTSVTHDAAATTQRRPIIPSDVEEIRCI